MKRKTVFYGDSNTYGFDPRNMWGGRYDKEYIWTYRLEEMTGIEAVNRGENGREIPHNPSQFDWLDRMLVREEPFDLLAVMLGTNDIFTMFNADAKKISERMEELLNFLKEHPAVKGKAKLLLVSPAEVSLTGYPDGEQFDKISGELGNEYSLLAEKYGVYFADAAKWHISMAYDGVHFSEEGHIMFAEEMEKVLNTVFG